MKNTEPHSYSHHQHSFMDVEGLAFESPSYLRSWPLLLAQVIESYGLCSEEVFKEAGADLASLQKNDIRFPSHQMQKVWPIAVARSQDPYIAIRVAHFFKPSAYSALGMAMLASRHVYDALKRASHYGGFIGGANHLSLQESEHEVAFVIGCGPGVKPLGNIYDMSATFSCLFNLLREVSPGALRVKEVHFEQSLLCHKAFQQFFCCLVYFGSDCNKLVFDKQFLFSVQPFFQHQLARSLDDWLEEYLAKNHHSRVSARVQKVLLKNLLHGKVDLPKVASALAMGIRALQLKLQEEGTLYSELLDDCRKKLSVQLILNNQHQMSEVSSMLGFSNQSNFTRAFRRWTGTTPLKYRG